MKERNSRKEEEVKALDIGVLLEEMTNARREQEEAAREADDGMERLKEEKKRWEEARKAEFKKSLKFIFACLRQAAGVPGSVDNGWRSS